MRDINFFEPYLLKESRLEERKPLYTALVAVLLVILVGVPAGLYGWILLERQAIDRMTKALEDPVMQENLRRVEDKQAKLNTMIAVLPVLERADAAMKGTDGVTDRLLQDVVDAIPPNTRFDQMELTGGVCKILGTARNRFDVAEFQYNLRTTGQFQNLLLEHIEKSSEGYSFSMTLSKKGGAPDEADKKGE